MNLRTKHFLRNLWFNLIVSGIAGNLFVVFRFFGTLDFYDPTVPVTAEHFAVSFLQGTFAGLLNGIAITFVDLISDTSSFKKRSFRFSIIFKSTAYTISILICIILIFLLDYLFDQQLPPENRITPETGTILTMQYVIAVFIFIMCVNLFINFFKEADKKFGPGVLFKLFSGRYFHPQIEERIFMFLDLKSSTSIAEKLGHIKYSMLIQECFNDITDIVTANKAEIYQYVGDEIVLSWEKEKGTDKNNCLNLFFEFKNKIESGKDNYIKKYGVVPEFKAGLNAGSVTVAEIGVLKKDIAYHGDVLNTASRIQGLCNDYNKDILISENLYRILPRGEKFIISEIGSLELKGKELPVKVFEVTTK